MFQEGWPGRSGAGGVIQNDEKGGALMIEAALALTMTLTFMPLQQSGAHQTPPRGSVGLHVSIAEAPTVCRMPIVPADAAVDKRFILKPAPDAPQMRMPTVGKLLPCPPAGTR